MSDRLEIDDLINTYAVAVDRRDDTLFATLWVAGSRMVVDYGRTGLGSTAEYSFPEEINRFLERLQQFDLSLHSLTTRRIMIDGESAAGELYCDAHYVTGAVDLLMVVRYDDRYARSKMGWCFTSRTVNVLWTSENQVNI
jgi:hypothetical protein